MLRDAVRRLGAKAAGLDPRSPEAETVSAFVAIEGEASKALRPLPLAGGEEMAPRAQLGAARAPSCDLQGIEAAGRRFEEAIQGFRGQVLSKMLPREVENLHRVVHTLEVLRNSLLHHFESPDRAGDPLPECGRYHSGVSQLESDLAHYRSQLEPPTKPPPRPVSQPLAGQLPPLELAPFGSGAPRGSPGAGPALDARHGARFKVDLLRNAA